jgi:hypothetical protein
MPKSLLDAPHGSEAGLLADPSLPATPPKLRPTYDSLLSAIHCLEHSDRRLRVGAEADADAVLALLQDAVDHLHEALLPRHTDAR